ncbi:MAG: Na/Pi cotransporter family protein, partial [Clostridia bacterium]|nr:Na/Pi cotransporter family protein [Clostridia bacterium]
IGVIVFLVLYYLVGWIFRLTGVFDYLTWADSTIINMWGIAIVHTLFKIFCVIVLSPMAKLIEKLACATVRGEDKKGDEYTAMLDDRLLDTPAVAIDRSRTVAAKMATLSITSLKNSLTLFENYDPKVAESVQADEDKADVYEDILGSYLVKLSARDMEEQDSHEVAKLLHMIGDFERISDHAANLVESAEEMKDKGITFSSKAREELATLRAAVGEIVTITEQSFVNADVDLAVQVEPLEQVVDYLKEQIRHQHIVRLQKSECTIEHGFILSDILTNLERVSDHCSNIAGCIIEMSRHEALDLHEYLHSVKQGGEEFNRLYEGFMEKYPLPSVSEKAPQTAKE